MHRELLKSTLLKYVALGAIDLQAQQQMLAFLEQHTDCFERTCIPGHFTASAWLLSADLQQVLLMHHAKLDIWLQLGGHCDGNSDVLQVAVKEAQEESGILDIKPVCETIFDLDVHEIPARNGEAAHLHYDVRFLLQVRGDAAIIQNHEAKDLRWFSKDLAAMPTREESVLRMFRKWQELTAACSA